MFYFVFSYDVILAKCTHVKRFKSRKTTLGGIHSFDKLYSLQRVTASFVAFQSVPFTLLGIHFLYRFWSVRHPHLIELFSNKKFIALLIAITVGSLQSWYIAS